MKYLKCGTKLNLQNTQTHGQITLDCVRLNFAYVEIKLHTAFKTNDKNEGKKIERFQMTRITFGKGGGCQ